tara:strand:- start:4713 stop:5003 length:291 start_codon:yes stop_codon:yes gene_type:complete
VNRFLLIAALLPLCLLAGCGPNEEDRVNYGVKTGKSIRTADGWIVEETKNTITLRVWTGYSYRTVKFAKADLEFVEKHPDQKPCPAWDSKTDPANL